MPVNESDIVDKWKGFIRAGMVLVDPMAEPRSVWQFETRVTCLHHATTIKLGYTATMHCNTVIQTVGIKAMSRDFFRSGETTNILWRFNDNAEFLKEGSVVLMRDGRTKMIGVISKIYFENEESKDRSL